ncbi:MAG TPA: FAD-binding protein, partial [Flavobacteriales bacterium]|nr:FAD-binding protein [Flavobacteriales bacterium]
MERVVDIALPPREAHDAVLLREAALEAAGWPAGEGAHVQVLKRSIDARSRQPLYRLRVRIADVPLEEDTAPPVLPDVAGHRPVVIVGCGPAGLFTALRCIAHG